MSIIYNRIGKTVSASLGIVLKDVVKRYSVTYTAGVEEYVDYYPIIYTSNYLSAFQNTYTLSYTSLYGDVINTYRLRYYSGVELSERLSRYTIKYISNFNNLYTANYTLRYSSLSPTESSFRRIYKVKYSSVGSKENAVQYTLRYSLEFFKDRSLTYRIKYNSHTPFSYNVDAVLVRNNRSTSALFCIRGSVEYLANNLFVFSNLPRYQLVSMDAYENKTNIFWLEAEDIKPYDLFLENSDQRGALPPVAYILIKDIDEVNNMSLDVYDKESLEKINKSKSFFFDLDSNSFLINPVTLAETNFTYVNYTSEYYNYSYLNFVERSLTPLFRLGDSCCFNTKIKSTTTGGMCSPF